MFNWRNNCNEKLSSCIWFFIIILGFKILNDNLSEVKVLTSKWNKAPKKITSAMIWKSGGSTVFLSDWSQRGLCFHHFLSGFIYRKCTEDGWSELHPPYQEACKFLEYNDTEPEVNHLWNIIISTHVRNWSMFSSSSSVARGRKNSKKDVSNKRVVFLFLREWFCSLGLHGSLLVLWSSSLLLCSHTAFRDGTDSLPAFFRCWAAHILFQLQTSVHCRLRHVAHLSHLSDLRLHCVQVMKDDERKWRKERGLLW